MGTIMAGPFEGLTVWLFQGARRGARAADKAVVALVTAVLVWQERARDRHRMNALSDFMLRDMGLSRADIEREARKPFWQS
jgi:uncharacterized protein YjiS (DUF1127 family)